MKTITLLFIILVTSYIFGGISSDTTFKADLNNDGKTEKVKVIFEKDKNGLTGKYTLYINKLKSEGKFDYTMDFIAGVVDLDKSDGFKEVLITSEEGGALRVYDVWKYDGNDVRKLGSFGSMDPPVFDGNGNVNVNQWMEFWTMDYYYKTVSGSLIPVKKDINDITYYNNEKFDITVTEPFDLFKEKNDGSSVSVSLKKGTKIQILRAVVNDNECSDESKFDCYWYFIKSDKGEGWARMKSFRYKAEGIPWAG